MHNIEFFTFEENVDKKNVQAKLDDYVARQDWEEGCRGLYNPIRWVGDGVFEDLETAKAYIEIEDRRRNYNCMAVRYLDYGRPKQTAKISKLEQAVKDQTERIKKIIEESDPRRRTSEFIGCPKCGSSLKRELLKQYYCPLCGKSLRSETNEKRIRSADARLHEIENDLKKEREDQAKKQKTKTRWLVKIEYHT